MFRVVKTGHPAGATDPVLTLVYGVIVPEAWIVLLRPGSTLHVIDILLACESIGIQRDRGAVKQVMMLHVRDNRVLSRR